MPGTPFRDLAPYHLEVTLMVLCGICGDQQLTSGMFPDQLNMLGLIRFKHVLVTHDSFAAVRFRAHCAWRALPWNANAFFCDSLTENRGNQELRLGRWLKASVCHFTSPL